MKKLILLFVLLIAAKPLYSQSSAFGPVLTYATINADTLTIFFYTEEKERSTLYISNDFTNYNIIEGSKSKYHSFEIATDRISFLYYKIISNTRDIKGKYGTIYLPERSSQTFAVYGQTYDSYDLQEELAPLIAAHSPNFVIHTGNLTLDTMNTTEWGNFFDSGKTLFNNAAFMPVIGANDFYNTLWKRIFDVSNSRNPFYSYNLPNLKIIVLNSSMYIQEDSVQYQWLIDELERRDPDNWLIVAFHQSPFDSDNYYAQELTDTILPVLEEYDVDVVFTGSSLFYERSEKNGIVYINSGGANRNMLMPSYINSYREKIVTFTNHYILGELSPGSLTLKAYDMEGNIIDSVTLTD